MAVSGLPERCNDHARKICNMALDMIEIVQEINTHKRKIQASNFPIYSIESNWPIKVVEAPLTSNHLYF